MDEIAGELGATDGMDNMVVIELVARDWWEDGLANVVVLKQLAHV